MPAKRGRVSDAGLPPQAEIHSLRAYPVEPSCYRDVGESTATCPSTHKTPHIAQILRPRLVGDAESAYSTAPRAFPYVKKQRTTPMTAERAQPRGSEYREFPPC